MYMEDTMWPFPGKVREYIEAAGTVYRRALGAEGSQVHMSIELALQTMPGAGRYPRGDPVAEAIEHPVVDPVAHQRHPGRGHRPGSWMHEALDLRDQWRSKLLRTAAWSPL